jgi:hypothetical protein
VRRCRHSISLHKQQQVAIATDRRVYKPTQANFYSYPSDSIMLLCSEKRKKKKEKKEEPSHSEKKAFVNRHCSVSGGLKVVLNSQRKNGPSIFDFNAGGRN